MAGETLLTMVGNLTADPEIRTTAKGTRVCNFTIASSPRVFNRQTNQFEAGATLFMRCQVWQDLADHVAGSLSKGMRVIVQGHLGQRSYQAQDGTNRTVIELTVEEIGPSLRFATVQVQRQAVASGYSGGNNGYQQNGGFNNSPQSVSSAPSGYSGGASYQQQQSGNAPDPWTSAGTGYSTSFGSNNEFSSDEEDPTF